MDIEGLRHILTSILSKPKLCKSLQSLENMGILLAPSLLHFGCVTNPWRWLYYPLYQLGIIRIGWEFREFPHLIYALLFFWGWWKWWTSPSHSEFSPPNFQTNPHFSAYTIPLYIIISYDISIEWYEQQPLVILVTAPKPRISPGRLLYGRHRPVCQHGPPLPIPLAALGSAEIRSPSPFRNGYGSIFRASQKESLWNEAKTNGDSMVIIPFGWDASLVSCVYVCAICVNINIFIQQICAPFSASPCELYLNRCGEEIPSRFMVNRASILSWMSFWLLASSCFVQKHCSVLMNENKFSRWTFVRCQRCFDPRPTTQPFLSCPQPSI